MTEDFQRCKECGIPDFLCIDFTKVSETEGYCEDHTPIKKDPKENARKLFNKFFGQQEKEI